MGLRLSSLRSTSRTRTSRSCSRKRRGEVRDTAVFAVYTTQTPKHFEAITLEHTASSEPALLDHTCARCPGAWELGGDTVAPLQHTKDAMADAPDKKRKKDKKDKKEKKRRRKEEDAEQTEEQRMKADTALAMIRFRNYTPRDKNLRVFVMPKPKIENKLDLEELSKPLSDSNAIMDIAPKKPNWCATLDPPPPAPPCPPCTLAPLQFLSLYRQRSAMLLQRMMILLIKNTC